MILFPNASKAHPFKDCSSLREQCFALDYSPQSPFFIKNPNNTKAAVLVHGLTDSAYFTKDLALVLSANGYNVYSILLTGHGTVVEDLFSVTNEKWIRDIQDIMVYAMNDSQTSQVVISGFSMGGVLASLLAENPFWQKHISNLILMAPAFKIKENLGIAMCNSGAYILKTWARNSSEKSPVRYNQMPFRSVCELTALGAVVRRLADSISVPVFMAVTDADQTISTEDAIKTFKRMSSQHKKLFYIQHRNTAHSDMVFRDDPVTNKKNPLFDQMSKEILQFLK